MKLNKIAALVALLAAGAANAAITKMDGVTINGDSSVLLVMLDSTGAQTRSLTVDLGITFSQFNAASTLGGAAQKVVWDLGANTVTGVDLGGATNDWSAQVNDFLANSDAAETKWALVAGSKRGSSANAYLATGTPTAAQLNSQNSTAASNMGQVDPLFTNGTTVGTHATADNGAFSAASTDKGYVGTDYAANTSIGGWKNNLKWNGWVALGGGTNLVQINANGTEKFVGDTATFAGGLAAWDTTGLLNDRGTLSVSADGKTVTWATAVAVPEAESYALALFGLLSVAALRRRAK